jgi:hypothetical protein
LLTSAALAQDPSGRPTKTPKKPPVKRPTPKPEPEPITVILTVLTNPPECEVYINGQRRGVSNAEGRFQVEKLPLAHYSIEVRKEGYSSSVRGFQAGSESPTLVFKLEPMMDRFIKEFDSLLSANRLAGPETPNALELVEKLSRQFPDHPEIARMKGVLATRFAEAAAPAITGTITNWRAIARDEITRALDSNTNALALKGDDKRSQAEGAYLRGVLALRDFLLYSGQGATEGAPNGGGLTGARSELEKAIQFDDGWAPPRYQLGVVQMYSGDSAGAEATFIKVTQMEPRWIFAHCYLGQAYHANGKFKEAIEAFRRALEIDPSYAAAYAGLGLARASKGERDAIKDIERAMQLDSTSGLPHLNMAIVLSQSRRRQDRDRAIQEFKTAIQKNGQNLDFLNSRAEQLLANLQKQKR